MNTKKEEWNINRLTFPSEKPFDDDLYELLIRRIQHEMRQQVDDVFLNVSCKMINSSKWTNPIQSGQNGDHAPRISVSGRVQASDSVHEFAGRWV